MDGAARARREKDGSNEEDGEPVSPDRLKRMVETELTRQELTGEEIAREARLPAEVHPLRRSFLICRLAPVTTRMIALSRAWPAVTATVKRSNAATERLRLRPRNRSAICRSGPSRATRR